MTDTSSTRVLAPPLSLTRVLRPPSGSSKYYIRSKNRLWVAELQNHTNNSYLNETNLTTLSDGSIHVNETQLSNDIFDKISSTNSLDF